MIIQKTTDPEKPNIVEPKKLNIIEKNLLGCSIKESPKLLPGVILAVCLVALMIWLTDLLNNALGFSGLISCILTVIVAGMLIKNFLTVPEIFNPGIQFCISKILRLGIILMGIRLSIFEVIRIGLWGIPIIIVCVVMALVVTGYFGRRLKLEGRISTLIAVGTSICGATAIVAAAPGIKARDEEVSYAVACITVFGIMALILYPFFSHWLFGGDTVMAGLFLGTSIHETAQVAAAGLVYDQTFGIVSNPTAGDIAMVTKLVRNILMALIIPLVTVLYVRNNEKQGNDSGKWYRTILRLFPIFILGFIAMAIIRSIGDSGIAHGTAAFGLWNDTQWSAITSGIKQWSGYLLATAMAGVGLNTSFRNIKNLGMKPFYVGLTAALVVGITSIIMVFLFGGLVTI